MNYGFLRLKTDPNAYILGGIVSLPKVVLQEDGNWASFFPKYEPQFNNYFDSYGCTIWGTQNAWEILLKRVTGNEYNFSERFNYILAGITPPGADPHYVAESIRERGMIPDELLTMTDSYEDFLKPNPMTVSLLIEGLKFPYELKHEYVWNREISKDERTKRIREALRYSPLGVSVTAWNLENGVYVDKGLPNTHWCVLGGEAENGWVIFDSYDQSVKILSLDHHISICKRYYLSPKEQKNWVMDLLKRLATLIPRFTWK